MHERSREAYRVIFRRLQERGLKKVWLVVSDAHAGLKAAVTECFLGSTWLDCYPRLATAYLIEYADDWSTSRAYIHPKDIEDQEVDLNKAA